MKKPTFSVFSCVLIWKNCEVQAAWLVSIT